VPFRTTESGTNKFKNNIKYSGRDLTNGKNTATKKIDDSNSPITFYTGKINWKIILSGNSKTGQKFIKNNIIVTIISFPSTLINYDSEMTIPKI
jgi:hypothetical protein